ARICAEREPRRSSFGEITPGGPRLNASQTASLLAAARARRRDIRTSRRSRSPAFGPRAGTFALPRTARARRGRKNPSNRSRTPRRPAESARARRARRASRARRGRRPAPEEGLPTRLRSRRSELRASRSCPSARRTHPADGPKSTRGFLRRPRERGAGSASRRPGDGGCSPSSPGRRDPARTKRRIARSRRPGAAASYLLSPLPFRRKSKSAISRTRSATSQGPPRPGRATAGATRRPPPRVQPPSGRERRPHFPLDERRDHPGVEPVAPRFPLQDAERRVARDGLLVGAGGGGEGVKAVTDRKRADGGRDALAVQPAGVAGPIELLVMRVRDLGNTGEIRRPRNRGEKAPRLRDMAFHGTAFVLGKAALRDRQEPELLGEEERRVAPAAIAVRAREERLQAPARILRQHGRLVRNDDLFEKRLEVAGASGRRRVERL